MNAYAALIAGAGGAAHAPRGAEAMLPAEPNASARAASTAHGDEPDFFAVLKGTIAGRTAGGRAAIDREALTTSDDSVEAERLGHLNPDGPETDVPIHIDTDTLEAEWLAPSPVDERGDHIPVLEIEIPNSESSLLLTSTGTDGDLTAPSLPLDAALLVATGGRRPGGSEITFASPTLQLGVTDGGSSPLTTVGIQTETIDTSLLASTGGETVAIGSTTPAILADPDLSLVDPELRTRLERVIDRMRIEYGHNVKVVEGFRTPERQDALFAQGRSADGPVVTWTQNSMHSEGLAVDVIVDGSYAPHEGYRRLARIAGEEGLQSLGAKDPGHLQLVQSAVDEPGFQGERFARIAEVQRPAVPETPAPVAQVAEVALRASIAEPAAVAQPAAVSQPAEVALPGSEGVPVATDPPQLADERLALESTANEGSVDRLANLGTTNPNRKENEQLPFGQEERNRGLARAALRRELRGSGERPVHSASAGEVDPRLAASARGENAATPHAQQVKAPSMVTAESMHRVTQVRELQELAYPRRLGQVTVRMLDGMSEEARMRVSLMGDGVATSIGVRDLAQADRMRSRIGTLEQALRQRGLEPTSTRIGALPSATAAEASVLTAQAVTGARTSAEADTFLNWQSGSDNTSRDDRDRKPNSGDTPPQSDEGRHPPREQHPENPQ